MDLDNSYSFKNFSKKKRFLLFRVLSGETNDTQVNFWFAIGLSSSNTSTYFVFGVPSACNFLGKAVEVDELSDDIMYYRPLSV